MGDHRASLKIELTLHEKTYTLNWDWVNWVYDGTPPDVDTFFRESWDDAYSRYQDKVAKFYEKQNRENIEHAERLELQRLKAKYREGNDGT
jgi:vacuolar-type H+-ATPase catalytic subunit A/Vma1